MAGGHRRRPELAGIGRRRRPKLQIQTIKWSASLVQNGFLEFWKWSFGERSYNSLERVFRGEEDGVVVGGQGGVCGGGNGGETSKVNGLF